MRFFHRLTILPLLIILTLSGCSAFDWASESMSGIKDYFTGGVGNADPPNALIEYTPEVNAEVLWEESVGVGTDEQTLKLVLCYRKWQDLCCGQGWAGTGAGFDYRSIGLESCNRRPK